jgi:hypothetical protein
MGAVFPFIYLLLGAWASAGEPWKSAYWKLTHDDFNVVYVGETYRVDVDDLRPAQFAVGMGEVADKTRRIADMSKGELRRYLKEKIGRVVLGPDREIWLIDGNHMAHALHNSGLSEMLVKIEKNWSDLSRAEFWKRMKAAAYVRLYDGEGRGPFDPETLPKKVTGQTNDLYRTLAWKLRRLGGYIERRVPFQEFAWADYLRARIPLDDFRRSPRLALKRAMQLAGSYAARGLPGWRGHCAGILTNK